MTVAGISPISIQSVSFRKKSDLIQLGYDELLKDRDKWLAKYQEQAERYQRLSDKYNKLLEEKLGLMEDEGE